MVQTSNVKLFDVQHSNDECLNDLKSNSLTFDKAKFTDNFQERQNQNQGSSQSQKEFKRKVKVKVRCNLT